MKEALRRVNLSVYDEFPVNTSIHSVDPVIEVLRVNDFFGRGYSYARITVLKNPLHHFSIRTPPGGCGTAEKPTVTATHNPAGTQPCVVATNAGYFNTTDLRCLGNLVSDGEVVQSPGIQNAQFGIRNGSFVVGYVSAEEAASSTKPFDDLVSGVGWLVRNGRPYVYASAWLEEMRTQETGRWFSTVASARTAIGYNKQGHLLLLQVDGQTWERGIALSGMAQLLVSVGAVAAVNLDGGGSSVLSLDGKLGSSPSDHCAPPRERFRCERPVSTITCIHASAAPPALAPDLAPTPAPAPAPAPAVSADARCGDVTLAAARAVTSAADAQCDLSPLQQLLRSHALPPAAATPTLTLPAAVAVGCIVAVALLLARALAQRLWKLRQQALAEEGTGVCGGWWRRFHPCPTTAFTRLPLEEGGGVDDSAEAQHAGPAVVPRPPAVESVELPPYHHQAPSAAPAHATPAAATSAAAATVAPAASVPPPPPQPGSPTVLPLSSDADSGVEGRE